MPELQNLADAQQTAARLFKVRSGSPATLLDDYAKAAWFLSQPNQFEPALARVSEKIWDKYRDYQNRFNGPQTSKFGSGLTNVFTTSIRDVAAAYGWQFGANINVLLVGAVTADQYEQWVTQGLFFKDDMDLKHGEYSHTFQWLALAEHQASLVPALTHTPHFLYQNCFNVIPQSNQQLIVPGLRFSDRVQRPEKCSLWSWVADCFPTSFAAGHAMPQGDSLFSDTYRTPQIIMQFLLDTAPQDHFIASYLRNRYKKRNWFTDAQGGYASVSGGSTSKTHATQQHSGAPGWTPVMGPSSVGAFTQPSGLHFRPDKKETVQVKFHGKSGLIFKGSDA